MRSEITDAYRESKLADPLDEAYLSVPTFTAEEGRAEAVGARSLNEFKKEHSWQLGDIRFPYKYSIDLGHS
ncbi:hypothetical protein ACGFW5_07455 [Streptomyces sp. NPDC048416]|uniref:hypothetical protein n=1 Tax=Streptomyces sp. NPDC048416 TaxID=3365546 RepID=UPI00371983D8